MDSGQVETAEMRYPTGHAKSAIDDGAIERKFHDMTSVRLGAEARACVLERLWNLERSRDAGAEVVALLGG